MRNFIEQKGPLSGRHSGICPDPNKPYTQTIVPWHASPNNKACTICCQWKDRIKLVKKNNPLAKQAFARYVAELMSNNNRGENND